MHTFFFTSIFFHGEPRLQQKANISITNWQEWWFLCFFKIIINPDASTVVLFHRSLNKKKKLSAAIYKTLFTSFLKQTLYEIQHLLKNATTFFSGSASFLLSLQHLTCSGAPFSSIMASQRYCFSDEIHQFFIIPEKPVADCLSLVDSVILPRGVKNRWRLSGLV